MPVVSTRERVFCVAAREYLLSFSSRGVTAGILDRYLEPGDARRPTTVNAIYEQLLWSAQNANMKSAVVSGSMNGGVSALSEVLFAFDPVAVASHFGDDSAAVLDDIVAKVRPRGQLRRTPQSIWPRYCKSIVSGAKFLTQFRDAKAFCAWVDSYDADVSTRGDLAVLIGNQVSGLGFALSCDFVKELGYSNFGKPDVHIKKILAGLDVIPESANDRTAFDALGAFAQSAGLSPYHVDKLMWLVGSGNFYKDSQIGDVPTDRDWFVSEQRAAFAASA